MPLAYISLGSNLGDREANLNTALDRMASLGKVVAVSSFYETEPVEFTAQPWFLNGVMAIDTNLQARALLDALLKIEQTMGRVRTQAKGPRTIDLDILLFDNEVIAEAGLAIPHPALAERRFVLEPLAEIAPGFVHPTLGRTVLQLRDSLSLGQMASQRVKRVAGSNPRSSL